MDSKVVMEVRDLKVHFEMKKSLMADLLGRDRRVLRAVDGVSFQIRQGEILSLVGESGCGKTTTGKALLALVNPTEGTVLYKGREILGYDKKGMKQFRRKAQMIFQDPYQSVNPRDTVMDIVGEPLDIHRLAKSEGDRREKISEALELAGLTPPEDFFDRYPHELSGGQRQRVVIASAIILEPDFLVADEPVSMLDASIRTEILTLMLELRAKRGLSYLFITHDLSLAWLISHRIAIMYLGRIMEIGAADDLIYHGIHPYTRALTSVMPLPGVRRGEARPILPGEIPSPTEELNGCKFCGRCFRGERLCHEEAPALREIGPDHYIACHFAEEFMA
jgi:oligopeptide/dipeptide ABC transporter ATP-binding protein